MRSGKNKKIMHEKGRRISLSPLRMLEYPMRETPTFRSMQSVSPRPAKNFYSSIFFLFCILNEIHYQSGINNKDHNLYTVNHQSLKIIT